MDFTSQKGGGLYRIRLSESHYYGGRARAFARRWAAHLSSLQEGRHPNKYMQNVFNQHGRFEPEILQRLSSVQAQMTAEQSWLVANFGQPGCVNLSPNATGGRGALRGRSFSASTRAKLSAALKGHVVLPGTRQKLREAHTGRVNGSPSPETCAKISAGLKGHTVSEETRAKISQALKGRPVPSEVARKGAETRRGRKRKPYSAEALNNIRQAARLRAERAKGKV